jgi:hypothetical protein
MKAGFKLMKQVFFGEMSIKERKVPGKNGWNNTAKLLSIADRPRLPNTRDNRKKNIKPSSKTALKTKELFSKQ